MRYPPVEVANACLMAGDLAGALEALNSHLLVNPGDDEARRLRAQVFARLDGEKHWRQALADVDMLAELSAEDYALTSIVLRYLKDNAGARAALNEARARFPDNQWIIENHLMLLFASSNFRDYQEARALLDTLPRTWYWLLWSGDVASEYEGEERAIEDYSAALALIDAEEHDPINHDFWQNQRASILANRAQMYWRLERLGEAVADFAAAYAALRDPWLLFLRGLIAADRGDLTDALALCGESLASASDFSRASMESVLRQNPRYAALATLLLQGDADV